MFLLLVVLYRSALFELPWHEHADYATNAIQTERAAQFHEIHGNYSRFDFYHPGPAFYYFYAAAETTFHRWLKWAPSPFNAHLLGGLIIQCFFFAMTLIIAERWIRRPLFVPLALLFGIVHFGLAGNACVSVWPPRTILMPLLCFIVGASSVAAGRLRDLPVTVFAACMLAHGHIAQPAFVLPAMALAGFAWWNHRDLEPPVASRLRAIALLTGGCLLLFLLPLAIDALDGRDSNLARIFDFWRFNHSPHKTLFRSLLYFCGYFGYVKAPEMYLIATGPDRAALTGELIPAYFAWAAVIAGVVAHLLNLRRAPAGGERRFIGWLCGFIVLAVAFCLYWGTLQVGKMYEYNGYFYYAVLGAILVVAAAAASTLAPPRPRVLGAALLVATAGLAWACWSPRLPIDYGTLQIPPNVDAALAADPRPAAPKYLVFDQNEWNGAASVALALKRRGVPFCANAEWGPRLEAGGAFEPVPPGFAMDGVSVWRLSRRGPQTTGRPIHDTLRLYFEPLPLDPRLDVIDCSDQGNLELYALFGFASPFRAGAWTSRPDAALLFDARPVVSDVIVTITAEPYALPNTAARQSMALQVNGREVLRCTLRSRGEVTARIPSAVWNARRPVMLTLHLPEAVDQRQAGISIERRALGWHIERFAFRLASTVP